jgi:hypothetical protein
MPLYTDDSEKNIKSKCPKKEKCLLLESILWYESDKSDQNCSVVIRPEFYELHFSSGAYLAIGIDYCNICGKHLSSSQSNLSDNLDNIPKI